MVYMSTAMLSSDDSDSLPACSSCQWSCCHIWSWGTSLTRPHSTSETAHRPVSCSKTPCVISSEVRHHVSSHLKQDTLGYLRRDTMCQLIWSETPCVISSEVRHHESYLIRSWIVAVITSHLVLKCQQGVIICTLDLQASLSVWTLLILQVNDEKKKTVYLSCFGYGCITKTGYVDSLFFVVFTVCCLEEKKRFTPQIAKSFMLSYQKSAVFWAFCVFGYPTWPQTSRWPFCRKSNWREVTVSNDISIKP